MLSRAGIGCFSGMLVGAICGYLLAVIDVRLHGAPEIFGFEFLAGVSAVLGSQIFGLVGAVLGAMSPLFWKKAKAPIEETGNHSESAIKIFGPGPDNHR